MDKLKYIKIENDDGSLSENIPIGTEAKYVDVDIAGGGSENLQQHVDRTNTQIDSLKTKTSSNATSVAAVANDLEIQKSRIDAIASLDEGSTTGDAELIDARVGYDGTTYVSAGEAIREQVANTMKLDDLKIFASNTDSLNYFHSFNRSNASLMTEHTDNKAISIEAGGYLFAYENVYSKEIYKKCDEIIITIKTESELDIYASVASAYQGGSQYSKLFKKLTKKQGYQTITIPTDLFDSTYIYLVLRIDCRELSEGIYIDWIKVNYGYSITPIENHRAIMIPNVVTTTSTGLVSFNTETEELTLPNSRVVILETGECINLTTRTISYKSEEAESVCRAVVIDKRTNEVRIKHIKNLKFFGLSENEYWLFWFHSNLLHEPSCVIYSGAYRVDGVIYNYHKTAHLSQDIIINKIKHAIDYKSYDHIYDAEITYNEDNSISINPNGYYFPKYKNHTPLPGMIYIAVRTDNTEWKPPYFEVAPCNSSGNDNVDYASKLYPASWDENLFLGTFDASDSRLKDYPMFTIRLDNRYNHNDRILRIASVRVVEELFGYINPTVAANLALFISPDGSDENTGGEYSPLASIHEAITRGDKTIMILPGIYNWDTSIDLSTVVGGELSIISAYSNQRVIINRKNREIATSEELVEGYTKVYKGISDLSLAITANDKWIIQSGVNDESTLISDEERHPCQRGVQYRCDSTKIVKTTATTLESALTEIENSNSYKFFYDSSTSTYYYSRPTNVDNEHPIKILGTTMFFGNGRRINKLTMSGIEFDGYVVNINNTNNSIISDCKVSNVRAAGGFMYNHTLSSKFIRCEASHVQSGSNGDGFNGHSENTGEPYSRQTIVTLEDCWSHDNNDDGYSDHERSEIVVRGGLYEYNGKGGITPSYGSHCCCYNVHSRNNYSGFFYCGSIAEEEGGMYGQMACYNCIAENNTRGGFKSGFIVEGRGNKALLVNCISIGNNIGYNIDGSTTYGMTLINCQSLNDNTIKSSDERIKVTNTNLVN